MINTVELEKRWYKYKTKVVLLVTSVFSLLSLLSYGGYYILYELNIDINKKTYPQAVMGIQKIKENNSSTIPTPPTSNIEKKYNDVLLSPTIPIIDLEDERQKDNKVKKRATIYHIAKAKKHHRIRKHHYKPHPKKRLAKAKTKAKVKIKISTHSRPTHEKKIKIQQSSNNYMSIMKQKFARNKNPRDAILIARAYYNAGNYKKSEEWALKANSLNSHLNESWLIFAKSKNKMGKRREALKILITYYNKSKSSKVKALIDKLRLEGI